MMTTGSPRTAANGAGVPAPEVPFRGARRREPNVSGRQRRLVPSDSAADHRRRDLDGGTVRWRMLLVGTSRGLHDVESGETFVDGMEVTALAAGGPGRSYALLDRR